MSITHRAAGLALALAASFQPAMALPPGISGAWYNPAQPGHGIAVEMIGGGRSDAFWFVYDHAGNPLHLYLVGEVDGNGIHYMAFENRGMRFGSFDPGERVEQAWGTVTLAFDSCSSGSLAWDAQDPAFGSGSMPLARLTAIDGLDCELDAASGLLPAGRYSGTVDGLLGGPAHAAVDSAGRLWATGHITPVDAYVGPPAVVAIGTPVGDDTVTIRLHHNSGLEISGPGGVIGEDTVRFTPQPDGDLAAAGVVLSPSPIGFAFEQRSDLPTIAHAFDPASLAGRSYVFAARSQFVSSERAVRFFADGSFCVEQSATACALHGQVGAAEPGLAMFAFTATGRGAEWSGKAWLEVGADGVERLVLVATTETTHSAGAGIGLVGERQ